MIKQSSKYLFCSSVLALLLLFCPGSFVNAERLSFRTYSTADGLVSDDVSKIVPDSHGFLWFCTVEGLSRFDGYKFKNYTQEHGLPHSNVNDLLETADGDYLVATSGGLAVFNPQGRAYRWDLATQSLEQNVSDDPLIKTYLVPVSPSDKPSKAVWGLAQDGSGNIYAATTNGLYRVAKSELDWTFQRFDFTNWGVETKEINRLFTDSRKDIWVAANNAIYWISKTGEVKKIVDSGGNSIFEDRDGKIWIDSGGNDYGIRVFEVTIDGGDAVLIKTYSKKDGLPANTFTNAVAHTAEGRIFVTSEHKLYEFQPNVPDGKPKFKYIDNAAEKPTTDRSGNDWFITPGKGVAKFSPNSFVTFDARDGIPNEFIRSIFADRSGSVYMVIGDQKLIRRDGDGKIETIVPHGLVKRMWTHNFLDMQSRDGEWWIPSSEGLRRYPHVAHFADLAKTPPKKIYTTDDGLFGNGVFAIFEDSRGDIWISTSDNVDNLVRFERSTETFYRYTSADGVPEKSAPITFGEDAAGNVWISFYQGELCRYKDGRFRQFTDTDGIAKGLVGGMLSDAKGRLWLAKDVRGIYRVDEPDADVPAFVNISTADGLSSNRTLCLAEDDLGRIYVGSSRGINRLEPEKQRIKIFTQADGLPGNIVSECIKGPDGKLWFASNNYMIQFGAQPDPPAKPPPIFIDSLNVNGNSRNVSEFGETSIRDLEFSSDERQVQIGFFAISLDTGEALRYQYKLEGQDWSQPDEQRTVSLNLSSGTYAFQVQAINADGIVSEKPATVSFRINPPFWRTWWFLLSAFLLIAGAVFVLDRYRVSKTRQVENALENVKESEERFRTLADTASDAILTIDEENTIVFVNQSVEKVFGYGPDEIIGRKLSFLIAESTNGANNHDPAQTPQGNNVDLSTAGAVSTGIHRSGVEIPLEVSFGEFERDGKIYSTAIARDISERRRAEAELQAAREEKFLELERVRTRIATDLHDDIGSSLTQIAVLTEVARGQASSVQAGALLTPLDRIKNVSRELVSVMSDIVWAINPQKDFLLDLVQRMRRFASDVFTARGIKFDLTAPEIDADLQLGANIRREVFAIFKESVNNAVKYSECTTATVKFLIEKDNLSLEIADNGTGFDTNEILGPDFRPEYGGNGLINMRRRAEDLGGVCEIISEPGRGTTITVTVPLHFHK